MGTTIELPLDDQHQLVVGGPDGEVIREEYIGHHGTITGHGPLVTDADGNWSVLVTVDATTAPEPTPLSNPSPSPTPTPTPEATPVPMLDAPTTYPTTAPATSSPTEAPAVESPPTAPTQAPGSTASPTAVPPPELTGMPASVAAIKVTVPASDISSLRALAPNLMKEVRPVSGSIIVSTNDRSTGDILVTPTIGESGLIEVRLSKFQIAVLHPVMRAFVAALNGCVAERGGRFSTISVSPESLTVAAVGSTREWR